MPMVTIFSERTNECSDDVLHSCDVLVRVITATVPGDRRPIVRSRLYQYYARRLAWVCVCVVPVPCGTVQMKQHVRTYVTLTRRIVHVPPAVRHGVSGCPATPLTDRRHQRQPGHVKKSAPRAWRVWSGDGDSVTTAREGKKYILFILIPMAAAHAVFAGLIFPLPVWLYLPTDDTDVY